jgi:hypothetical protein
MAAHQYVAGHRSMIDNWLDDVQVQYQTLEECRPTLHVLDDYTEGRVFEVYSV